MCRHKDLHSVSPSAPAVDDCGVTAWCSRLPPLPLGPLLDPMEVIPVEDDTEFCRSSLFLSRMLRRRKEPCCKLEFW